MPSQADKIREYMEHQVTVTGEKALQAVADELQAALRELTPKRTGKTAASWTQERTGPHEITIHTRLETGDPARWIIELNEGGYKLKEGGIAPPTKFIEAAIARGLAKVNGGGSF